jgi:hypothetical protein
MKSSDLGLAIFIFTVFIALYFFNILIIGMKTISANWPVYRCNPMIMPFASSVGPKGTDNVTNFVYCIQNMQSNYMGHLLKPINFNMSLMGANANILGNSINSARTFISHLTDSILKNLKSVFGIFYNIMIESQRLTINIKDLFGKFVGILASIIFILDGSLKTMGSAWNGPTGGLVRGLGKLKICFKPDTLIQTANGNIVKMEDVQLGEKLKNGSEVLSVMKIYNLDENKQRRKSFYKISQGELNQDIFVTGCHLIYNPAIDNFQKVKEYPSSIKTDESSDYFICLITSNHIIPIGDKIFHDWEDNNGSQSKQL